MEKKKILIVDDEESFPKLVKMMLERSGDYEVTYETVPTRAVNAAREIKPDAILLDVIMPELNGPELKVKMNEDSFLRKIPKIFLTSIVNENDTTSGELVETGDGPMLPKTAAPDFVVHCVEEMLAGRLG